MVMVLVRVMVVRVRLDVSVQQQKFTGDHGDQREHDEDFDFRQYDSQHTGEQGSGRCQVALDPSAFWNPKIETRARYVIVFLVFFFANIFVIRILEFVRYAIEFASEADGIMGHVPNPLDALELG